MPLVKCGATPPTVVAVEAAPDAAAGAKAHVVPRREATSRPDDVTLRRGGAGILPSATKPASVSCTDPRLRAPGDETLGFVSIYRG